MIRKTKDMCKLKIQGYDDRAKMVSILANSGYDVRIEEEENFPHSPIYFVIVSQIEGDFIGFDKEEIHNGVKISELLIKIGLAKDKSEGHRLIQQGAIYINSKKIDDIFEKINECDFIEGKLTLKKGKSKTAEINLIN